jgi:hypothetical protein
MSHRASLAASLLVAVLFFLSVGETFAAASFGFGSVPNAVPLNERCVQLFGLPSQTVTFNNIPLNATTCQVYLFLYDHLAATMACTTGGPNGITKAQAITGLNYRFADYLYHLLLTQPSLSITSAYRKNICPTTTTGAISKASYTDNDPHQRGCAADLGYDQNTCGPICQAVKTYTLQNNSGLRLPFVGTSFQVTTQGESNHVEASDLAGCEANNGNKYAGAVVPSSQTATFGSGSVTPGTQANYGCDSVGLVLISSPGHCSPASVNGGSGNQMTSMLGLMMGMQLSQTLASSLTNANAGSASYGTGSAVSQPTPLPPLPISSSPGSSGDSSTLDALLAALDSSSSSSTSPQACTQEVQICPDGSAVGRTGPNCSFAACPDASSTGSIIATTTPTLDASSTEALQSALHSLQVASATIMQSGSLDSTSTLQSLLGIFSNTMASLLSFFMRALGITPATS